MPAMTIEAEFKAAWQACLKETDTPETLAYSAGAAADRLAMLFLAGYQSAVRRTFGLTGDHWTVLAVSEDRSPDNPLPGTTLDENQRLSGYKTWVAASRHVDDIIISVGEPVAYFSIPVGAEGLSLQHKEGVSFLPEMSQGIAGFDKLQLDETHKVNSVNGADIKAFAKREPLYLYYAFCGFLAARTGADVDAVMAQLDMLSEMDIQSPEARLKFAEIDDAIVPMMQSVPDDVRKGSWDSDQGLITLYSKGIQKRASYYK